MFITDSHVTLDPRSATPRSWIVSYLSTIINVTVVDAMDNSINDSRF